MGHWEGVDWSLEEHWGNWREIDKFFYEQFATHGDFTLIIKTGKLCEPDTFQRHAKESFPLLASRECIHFETSDLVDEYLR